MLASSACSGVAGSPGGKLPGGEGALREWGSRKEGTASEKLLSECCTCTRKGGMMIRMG